jgi:pyruvate/oxaloacetate carboxyltransferase
MKKKLLIRDVTLRDGQQSLFATRMSQAQVDKVLPFYKDAGFYAMEVWGGAVPDSVMRYLNEDPWERLEKIKSVIGNTSKLTALSRGRNLFGYNPYPDEVIEGFNRNAVKSGIDIMRIFDALNDVDNMKSTIKFIKENGGIADCAICFTVDPKFTPKQMAIRLLHGKKPFNHIFTDEYFVEKAVQMEKLGADMISIKDMAGLITPIRTGKLIKKLKKAVKLPINIHTHCTPGYGLAAVLTAMVNDVDIVDTSIFSFAGGPAAPAFEIIQIFANKLGLETGVNLTAVVKIEKELRKIRQELKAFDTEGKMPNEFDITKDRLPAAVDKVFDQAILFAKGGKETALLKACHAIEKYFNFPEPNEQVKLAEIPGGMYTNMLAQLKQLKLDHLLPRVLELVPQVRLDSGCPPLVTPTSQIVGVQAVNCVIDENGGNPHYTNNSVQFVNLVKGQYGKTPIPVNPEFRKKIAGVKKDTPYDTSSYQKQENYVCYEFGGVKLAKDEKEELLLELFPSVTKTFLRNKIENNFISIQQQIEMEQRIKREEVRKKYLSMSAEEKERIILNGLYNIEWKSDIEKLDVEKDKEKIIVKEKKKS